MRTYKWMAAIVLLLGMTSCGTYYRMVSQVNSDGSMHREVYAYGDSAFLAGDRNHNPFLFRIDSGWEVSNLDSVVKFNCWGDTFTYSVSDPFCVAAFWHFYDGRL